MGFNARHVASDRTLRQVVVQLIKFTALVLFAVFVGQQIYSPNPRIIKLAIALILLWLTLKSSLPSVVALLAFVLPFSSMTVLGPTSSTGILIVFLIWMARLGLGSSQATWKSPLSLCIVAFLLVHVVSFYSIDDAFILEFALRNLGILVSGVLLLYLILNFVTDEKGLRRLIWASAFSCMVIIVLSLLELFYPTLRLIPWFTMSGTQPLNRKAGLLWIGGPFRDGELLGEYMAVCTPIMVFMFTRSRSMYLKAFWALMVAGALCTALATMHRMPLVSMSIGIVYLVFLFRRRMKPHTVMLTLVLGTLFVLAAGTLMTEYTPTGSVFSRIEETKFYGGVPDSRRAAWGQAWERSMERPWLGHGPVYDIRYTVSKLYAPHNSYLYYFYTIGVIGVATYLWLMVTLVRMTAKYMSARRGPRGFVWDLLIVQHVQVVVFLIDTVKINFQRSPIYTLLVWLLFGTIAATYRIASSRAGEMRSLQRARLNGEPNTLHPPGPPAGRLSP